MMSTTTETETTRTNVETSCATTQTGPEMVTETTEVVTMGKEVEPGPRGKLFSLTGANTYAAKKTVAQGMMDIALITANANQLRYVMEYSKNSPTFYLTVVLITFSLILQLLVGVILIFKGRFDLKGEEKRREANKLNNYVVVGVFLITIINVFIAAFSVNEDRPSAPIYPVYSLQPVQPYAPPVQPYAPPAQPPTQPDSELVSSLL